MDKKKEETTGTESAATTTTTKPPAKKQYRWFREIIREGYRPVKDIPAELRGSRQHKEGMVLGVAG